MPGMMRFKSEKDFQDMLKGTHLRIAPMITGKKPAVMVSNPTSKTQHLDPALIGAFMEKPVGSDLEELFAQQLHLTKLPKATRQYLYLRGSKHTLDFAWPELMLGVEVQGHVHRIKDRFKADMVKRSKALLQGWRVLEVGGSEIRDGTAMQWLHELFELVNKGE